MSHIHLDNTCLSWFCLSGDETGTKVPSCDLEMPQHDYDEVAMDKGMTTKTLAPIDTEPDEVCILSSTC